MPLTLYPHQAKAIASLYTFFHGNPTGHPCLVAPTGSGKSLIQAEFIKGVIEQWPTQRVLCLTHVRELVEQNYQEMIGQWPDAPAGIDCAALKRREPTSQILFASVQSTYKKADAIGHCDLIFIDEAHLCPVKTSAGMYRTLIDDLLAINPALRVIGMTATPYRLDNGSLTYSENALFTDLIPDKVNCMEVATLVDKGYLSALTNEAVRVRYALSQVAVRGGDYVPSELEKVVNLTAKNMAACNEMKALGTDRKSWLVFTISVDHAFHISESLKMLGIRAAVLTGETPAKQRAQLIEDFKTHKIRALVNVNCLTTGFNARGVDLIAFMRPTKSPGLYSQMAGRGMRLSPETGKTDCLVLDFAGLIETHGPITQIKPPPNKDDPDGDSPEKECPACYMLVNLSARQCPYCQHVFEKEPETSGTSISPTASTIDIMGRDQATAQHRRVHRMNCYIHKKEGQPASLKVIYYALGGDQIATEWVCLFHRGYAKKKAMQWWADHLPGDKQNPAPIGIDEAVQRAKQWGIVPLYLNVEADGRYMKINYRVMPTKATRESTPGRVTDGIGESITARLMRQKSEKGISCG